ncbi:MAG: hypothetical protein VSS52_000610, partial [Thiotrichaceae bacterium]|nr:hypothetical protein [Thiotrichaceae bacterium]
MHANQNNFLNFMLFLFIVFFVLVLFKTAWINDDAYITFRTIDNFVNGYGLRWNIAERVQSYTNPLWLFLLSGFYFVTHEIYFTSLYVSILLTMISVSIVVFKIATSYFNAFLSCTLLILSKAFIDFSASGLEQPLLYVIIASFFVIYLYRDHHDTILLLALLAALGTLTRLDAILFFIFPLLWILYKNNNFFLKIIIGFTPLILWELFSLIYYGSLFPNTAYAKLNTGISSLEAMEQGLIYIYFNWTLDPLTIITLVSAIFLPLLLKQWKLLPLSLSILITIFYVIKIGGNFMGGRFICSPFLIA